MRIAIRDAAGTLVTTLYGPGKAGFDTVVWNLRYKGAAKLDPPLGSGHGGGFGPAALPGQYTATVHAGTSMQRVTLKVESDPRYSVSLATDRADTQAGLAAREELSAVNRLLNHVASMRKVLAGVLARGKSAPAWGRRHAALLAQGKTLQKTLTSYQNTLWNPHTQHDASEDFLRHFSHLHRKVDTLYGMSAGLWGAKPRAQLLALIGADRTLIEQLLNRYDGSVLTQVKAWNSAAYAAGVATLPTGSAVTLHTPPALPPAAGA